MHVFFSRFDCLDWGQYGELIQLEASRDGNLIALLVKTRSERYVVVINLRLGRVIGKFVHRDCERLVLTLFIFNRCFLYGADHVQWLKWFVLNHLDHNLELLDNIIYKFDLTNRFKASFQK